MKMKFQSLCFGVFVFAMIAVGSASAVCTNATLNGVWGYQVGPTVGHFTADANGNITAGSQTMSQNGVISTQTYTGTYALAKNCTGTITLTITGGGSATVYFVVDNTNKGAQVISTESGGVAGGISLAQGTVTCGLTGVKQTFAANLFGKIPGTGNIAYVAQVILDGKGGVSGSGVFDVAGTITPPVTLSGTYTEATDCTGTVHITVSGVGTLNFNTVVVNGGKEILLLETDTGTVVAGSMQK